MSLKEQVKSLKTVKEAIQSCNGYCVDNGQVVNEKGQDLFGRNSNEYADCRYYIKCAEVEFMSKHQNDICNLAISLIDKELKDAGII